MELSVLVPNGASKTQKDNSEVNLAQHGGLSKTSQGACWSQYIYMTLGVELILPVWPEHKHAMCMLGTGCLLLLPEARVSTNMLRPRNTKIHSAIFLCLLWCHAAPQWFRRSWPKANWLHESYVLKDVFVLFCLSYLCFVFWGGTGHNSWRQQDGECHSWTVTFLATQIVFRQLAGLACGAAGRREKGLTLTRWWETYRHLPKPRHPFVIVNWFSSPAHLLEQDRSSN